MDKIKREQLDCGVSVILQDPSKNPHCPHGPTMLLSKKGKGDKKCFYVCSAQRDRKFCSFYKSTDELLNISEIWKQKCIDYIKGINHIKMFMKSSTVKLLEPSKRIFCFSCNSFVQENCQLNHGEHKYISGITDHQFLNPTEILPPSEIDKSEAQYWFSKSSVDVVIKILKALQYKNVICIGAPRIHEYIRNNCEEMTSILLDFDKRFHNFFGPLEFCWYNLFNNHFYFAEAKAVFLDFLQMNNGDDIVIVTDPPFGGRTEPIAYTLRKISKIYQKLNKRNDTIPAFWIFPYFMEQHIKFSDSNFVMLDYKVEYENHNAFNNGPKGRKQGSPVRIFTTVNPSLISLEGLEGYKYCKLCDRWVSDENSHCNICQCCPSKDGRTYVHCTKCKKCVKPTWIHCKKCQKCQTVSHNCEAYLRAKRDASDPKRRKAVKHKIGAPEDRNEKKLNMKIKKRKKQR